MVVETAAPLHAREMKVWTGLGGKSSGIIGNPAHRHGFHRGAFKLPGTDYSRFRDPVGADGPYPDWGWCCAGDYWHGGNPLLRARHLVLLTRLMDNDPELADVCEFIGQPWAGKPVLYWARWNGVRVLKLYSGQGHDVWSHISVYRSEGDSTAALWAPASAATGQVKSTTKASTLRAPAFPKSPLYFKASAAPRYSATVRSWQARMKQRGWAVKADGYFGPTSATLCRQFQAQKKITVDGLLGPRTFALAWTSPVT